MDHPTQTNRMAKQILQAAVFQWNDKRYSLRSSLGGQSAEAALEAGPFILFAHSIACLGVCPSNVLALTRGRVSTRRVQRLVGRPTPTAP